MSDHPFVHVIEWVSVSQHSECTLVSRSQTFSLFSITRQGKSLAHLHTEDFQKIEGTWEKLMLVYATTFLLFSYYSSRRTKEMWLHMLTLGSLLLPQPSGNPLFRAFCSECTQILVQDNC